MSPFTQYFRYREVTVSNDDLVSEEYSVNLKELQAEWDKAKPSNTHIKLLLRHLRQYRKRWMTSLPDGTIQPIIEAYLCFPEGQHVLWEFFAMVYPEKEEEQARQDVCQKVEWLLRHVANTMKANVDGVASVKEAFFESKEFTSPRLIIVVNKDHNSFMTAYIVVDRTKIACQAASSLDAAVVLLAAYYVSDLSYPGIYTRALGLLQQFVVGDAYSGPKGTKWITFVKRLTLDSP